MENYKNLKNKTFLDFTDDQAIIDKILDGDSVEFFINGVSPMGRLATFVEFAELTKNKALEAEAIKQFEFIFNE